MLIVVGFLVFSGFLAINYITNKVNTRETEAEEFLNLPYKPSPRPTPSDSE